MYSFSSFLCTYVVCDTWIVTSFCADHGFSLYLLLFLVLASPGFPVIFTCTLMVRFLRGAEFMSTRSAYDCRHWSHCTLHWRDIQDACRPLIRVLQRKLPAKLREGTICSRDEQATYMVVGDVGIACTWRQHHCVLPLPTYGVRNFQDDEKNTRKKS